MSGLTGHLWRVLLSYATALDTKAFDLLEEVFHPDVRADHSPGPVFASRVELIERMVAIHTPLAGSLHRLTNFQLISSTPTDASCRTYVDAVLIDGTSGQARITRDLGCYLDKFQLRDGTWKISARRYERVLRTSGAA
jgi:SnoaL-like domain